MNSRGNVFRSKVARRVFTLFIISSLIPVLILAVLSLYQVKTISSEQVASRLKQDAKFYGLSLYDRLQVIEEELLFHASMLDARGTLPTISARDSGHLSDWRLYQNGELQTKPQQHATAAPVFDDGAMAHMRKGRSVLSMVDQQSEYPALFMSRIVNLEETDLRILTGRIHQIYLWGDPDRFTEDVSACVLDASYSYIHCTNSAVHPVAQSLSQSGGLTAKSIEQTVNAKEMLMGRWVLFMQPNYFTNKWNILLFQNRQEAFAQLKQFTGIYAVVILLVILVVALFSIYFIRKNTVPLEALMKGIGKISEQEFTAKVTVDSHDEYKEVADAFNRMSGQIGSQINRLKTQAHIQRYHRHWVWIG